jgi:hypothetical protein
VRLAASELNDKPQRTQPVRTSANSGLTGLRELPKQSARRAKELCLIKRIFNRGADVLEGGSALISIVFGDVVVDCRLRLLRVSKLQQDHSVASKDSQVAKRKK